MATGDYRLTAVLAFLLVAGTTAAGWQGGRPPDNAASRVVPLALAGQATGRAAAIEMPSPNPRATPDAAAAGPRRSVPGPAVPARPRRPPAWTSATTSPGCSPTAVSPTARCPWNPGARHAASDPARHLPRPVEGRPNYISTEYDEPMPYAVFFAPGGVAFHGGSLTTPSHGCVHLDIGSARYYHDHLPVGAEVVVF